MQLLEFAGKYLVVGLASNGVGFIVYLLLTKFYLEPKSAMSVLYVLGAAISFYGNKLYAFESTENWLPSAFKFFLAHIIGYILNYSLLKALVDVYGFPHQLVQAIAIFVVAAVLFILFRYFVFPAKATKEVTI